MTGEDARRLIGLGVVGAVLLLITVIGAIPGRVVAGEAQARPADSAPATGDCLTENPHRAGADPGAGTPVPLSLELRTCTGPRFGEVVFVEAEVDPATTGQVAQLYCAGRADRYLGIPPRLDPDAAAPDYPATTASVFSPTAAVSVAIVGPDIRQRAAGQRWAACVIYLPAAIPPGEPITVDHSLRGAWLRPEDSHLFSLCLTGPTSRVALNCRWPHRMEMIGMGWGNPTEPAASVDSACRELVVGALGSAAALVAGAVDPVVVPLRPNSNHDGGVVSGPAAVSESAPYLNICLVRAADSSQRLTAPLRGLGDAPVPTR